MIEMAKSFWVSMSTMVYDMSMPAAMAMLEEVKAFEGQSSCQAN
jgi:hypothetical protein